MTFPQVKVGDIVWWFLDRNDMRTAGCRPAIVTAVGRPGVLSLHQYDPELIGSRPLLSVHHYLSKDFPPLGEETGCWSERDPKVLSDCEQPQAKKAVA